MPTKSLVTKPGEFKARCSLRSHIPWDKMTDELWAIANERGYTREFREMASGRVDPETRRRGRWEVTFPCTGFESTDRAAYLEHMATVHNRKPSGPAQIKLGKGMWRGPRLLDEGQPWDDTRTRRCDACGLVAEVSPTEGFELWWREHLDNCVGQAVA